MKLIVLTKTQARQLPAGSVIGPASQGSNNSLIRNAFTKEEAGNNWNCGTEQLTTEYIYENYMHPIVLIYHPDNEDDVLVERVAKLEGKLDALTQRMGKVISNG